MASAAMHEGAASLELGPLGQSARWLHHAPKVAGQFLERLYMPCREKRDAV